MDDITNITPEEEEKILNAYRASGEVICEICGISFYKHPLYEPSARASYDGNAFLHELCNGDLVKL